MIESTKQLDKLEFDRMVSQAKEIEYENKNPGFCLLYNLIRTLNIPADTIFYPERHNMPHKMDIAIDELVNMLYLCDEKTIHAITAAVQEIIQAE